MNTFAIALPRHSLAGVAMLPENEALQAGTFSVNGTTLIDTGPDISDPPLVLTDIVGSNGILPAIGRDFQLGIEQIDISPFTSGFDELDLANRTKWNGGTNWIDINDDTGETEIIFRFDSATPLDAANLTEDAFFFG